MQVTVGHVLPAVPVLVAHDRQSLEITVAVALAPTRPLRVFIERRDTAAADAAAAAAGDPPADADTVELEVPIACSIAGLQHLVTTSTGTRHLRNSYFLFFLGSFLTDFSSLWHLPTRAVCYTLLSAHACWMLTVACNPML